MYIYLQAYICIHICRPNKECTALMNCLNITALRNFWGPTVRETCASRSHRCLVKGDTGNLIHHGSMLLRDLRGGVGRVEPNWGR